MLTVPGQRSSKGSDEMDARSRAAAFGRTLAAAAIVGAAWTGITLAIDASAASVEGRVALKSDEEAGYTADFALTVTGLSGDVAERVLNQAKQLCPFTKALASAGITVELA